MKFLLSFCMLSMCPMELRMCRSVGCLVYKMSSIRITAEWDTNLWKYCVLPSDVDGSALSIWWCFSRYWRLLSCVRCSISTSQLHSPPTTSATWRNVWWWAAVWQSLGCCPQGLRPCWLALQTCICYFCDRSRRRYGRRSFREKWYDCIVRRAIHFRPCWWDSCSSC